MKIYTKQIVSLMWERGFPCTDARYANIVRAGIKAGLNLDQAFMLALDAFKASHGYSFDLPKGSGLYEATRRRNAAEHPNGKDAEDLAAEREGRPSRWGTPEFHRNA